MTIQSFKRKSESFPKFGANKRRKNYKHRKGSRIERGYDQDWVKLSKQYRIWTKGLCEECARRGFVSSSNVVDHMIPISQDPRHRLNVHNLDALCHLHHNGLKRKIEEYAIKTDQVSLLPMWMKFPPTRPAHFQITKKFNNDVVGDGVVLNAPIDMGQKIHKPVLIDLPPRNRAKEIFSGFGVVHNISNHSNAPIEIYDGDQAIYYLQDGDDISAPMEISDGLSVLAVEAGSGKISLTYVESGDGKH